MFSTKNYLENIYQSDILIQQQNPPNKDGRDIVPLPPMPQIHFFIYQYNLLYYS